MLLDLLVAIVEGLVTALILALLAFLFSRRLKAPLIRFLLRGFGVGVEQVYPTQAEAENDIINAIKRTDDIRVLVIRGRSVVEGYLSFLIHESPFRKVRLLVADPDAPDHYNPVIQRAAEIERSSEAIDREKYLDDGRSAIRQFYLRNRNGRCRIRAYQFPAVFRLVATGGTMFLSFYPVAGKGKDNTMFRLQGGTPLCTMFERYFDKIWEDERTREPIDYKRAQRLK